MRSALRKSGTVQGAAEALGMSSPNFQQQWRRRCEHAGIEQTPAEWLESEGLGEPAGEKPRVFFRYDVELFEQLVQAAGEDGLDGPNDLARELVTEGLRRRAKRLARRSAKK